MRIFTAVFALAGMVAAAGAQEIPAGARRSGADFMSAETRALQADDAANPAMLSVRDGEDIWNQKAGAAQKSCADCHGDATLSMRGAAARYPAYDAASARPLTLEGRINACRRDHQRAAEWPPENPDLLGLSAFVGLQSRGMPLAPPDDPRLTPFRAAGRALYTLRQGQLNLACAQCHDQRGDKKLGGSPVTQGQANGYPEYRLEWQSMGSLERRIRNCLIGVRAEPYTPDSPEMLALQVYLAQRAAGMVVETPAVRP